MKYLILIYFIVFLLTMAKVCRADDDHEQFVHDMAHLGLSFTINDLIYRSLRHGLGLTQTESLITSGCFTESIGFLYKYTQAFSNPNVPRNTIPGLGRSMLFNTIGIGLNLTVHIGE